MKFKSKSILITGGGRGIGKAFAIAFAKEGANISLCARTLSELREVKNKLKEYNIKILIQPCDVSKSQDVSNWVNKTILEFKRIDVLVNNAGIYGPIGELVDNEIKEWVRAIEINLIGTVNCMKFVLPIMIEQKEGVIINMSGGGALNPFPNFSAYSASKAAVVRLTETVSEEVKKYNIRINAISPGAVNTKFLDKALSAGEACGKDYLKKCKKQKETGGTPPEKAAELALFLASDEAQGTTGKVISAVWDDWRNFSHNTSEINGTSLYTMRRIDNKNFREIM